MTGFKTLTRSDVVLAVGQQLSLALKIEVGAVTETVNVSAGTPLLDTSSVSSGQNFDTRMVEGLPMFSNMPIMLTRFAAGVNPSTNQSLVSQGFADGTTQAAGAAFGGVGSNTYSIDGATNAGSGRRIAASPNSDMIQEMRVESSNFDASVGHGTGLQISMVTRSGANDFRGTGNYRYLDQQDQRAEPESEADVHAHGPGALRDGPVAQHGDDIRRARRDSEADRRPQQALLLRQLLVRQRLHSREEPGLEHRAGDRGPAHRRFLRPAQAAQPGSVPDLRSVDRPSGSVESQSLHPQSVPEQHHSGQPDRESALQPVPADGAEAQSEPAGERRHADQQLLPGRRTGQAGQLALRRPHRLQQVQQRPLLRPRLGQYLHRAGQRLDLRGAGVRRAALDRSLALQLGGHRQLDAHRGQDAHRYADREQPLLPGRSAAAPARLQAERHGPARVSRLVLRRAERLHAAGRQHRRLSGHLDHGELGRPDDQSAGHRQRDTGAKLAHAARGCGCAAGAAPARSRRHAVRTALVHQRVHPSGERYLAAHAEQPRAEPGGVHAGHSLDCPGDHPADEQSPEPLLCRLRAGFMAREQPDRQLRPPRRVGERDLRRQR